jgi:CDP-diacylglycerol--glycerol-3-phosphate 3-phosphatidyltransferase/cardiolipin synthase
MRRAEMFSLPNVVSLSRVVCAAAVLAVRGPGEQAALIGIASATDFLDGWLARRRHVTTRLGALLDPIADRCFVVACVAALVLQGALTTAQSLILLSRDLATALGFVVARSVPWLRAVPFQARSLGKVVTALQLATLLSALLFPMVVDWLIVALAVMSAAAIIDYTLALWRARAT